MRNAKGDSRLLKEINVNLVLNALVDMKTATRGRLAQRTGLSQPTVNAIVRELEEKGIVCPGNFSASAGGRRPQCYALHAEHLRTVVARVLPHGFAHAVLAVDGGVVGRGLWNLEEGADPLAELHAMLNALLKQDDAIRTVSVGVPGVVGPGGVLYAIPQIPGLEGISLAADLEARCGLPVFVENDMNLVALGSASANSGQLLSDMVFIHIGQGVGAGIVMGGRIIRGFSSFAGEIAHMFNPASANISGGTLETRLKQTDSASEKARLIAGMVVNVICLLNPPVIAFGGSLVNEDLLWRIRRVCETHLPAWTLPAFQQMADEDAAYDAGLLAQVRGVLTGAVK